MSRNPEQNRKNFSKKLSDLLEKKGISQSELARRVGVQRSNVWGWLNEKHQPSKQNLKDIARLLEVDPAYLAGLTDSGDSFERRIKPIDTSWKDSDLKEAFRQTEQGLSRLRALMEARGIL